MCWLSSVRLVSCHLSYLASSCMSSSTVLDGVNIKSAQWRHHGIGGFGPPTLVQTPPGISANQLKSYFIYIRWYPMHVNCNFYCHQQRNIVRIPHFFWGWRRHWIGLHKYHAHSTNKDKTIGPQSFFYFSPTAWNRLPMQWP